MEISETAPYTFSLKVIVNGSSGDFQEDRLRKRIEEIKPAHLAYEIVTERPITGHTYMGAVMQQAEIMNIRQVI